MNKTKVKEVIKFSFFNYFHNKWFIIFNIITLLSILIPLNIGTFIDFFNIGDEQKVFEINIIDNENLIYDSFYKSFENNEKFKVSKVFQNDYTSENIVDDLAIIEVIKDDLEMFKTKITSKEGIKNETFKEILNALNDSRNELFSKKYDLDLEKLKILQSDVSVERILLSVDAENSETKNLINLFASAFTYIVAVIVFTRIANEIAQEKSSKSSEYILTTITGKEYLFAKVFGNILIFVVQMLLIVAYYLISACILSITKANFSDISLMDAINISGFTKEIFLYILALLFYNVITLILLSIIQATLAAKTASSQEAGNTVSILIFVMAIMYVLTVFVINPYSKVSILIYILSMLPIVSSFFVPAMMVIGQATIWQIVGSILLLLILIPKVFNYCSKAFKNGILDYKKSKKKKDLIEIPPEDGLKKLLNRRNFSRLGSIIGIAILIYIGTQLLFPLILTMFFDTYCTFMSDIDKFLLNQMLSQICCLGIAYLFLSNYIVKNKKERKTTSLKKPHIIIMAFTIIMILQFLIAFIYPLIGLNYDMTDILNVNSDSPILTKIILFIAIAITPAILEELFFRKGLIDLCSPYGKKFALLISALLFGFIHMNLSQGIFAIIFGLIMGCIYLYTKDIKISMIIHLINNGYAAIMMCIDTDSLLQSGIIALLLLITLLIGLIFLIIFITNKTYRTKLFSYFKTPISLESFKQRHIYMLYDYIFDISIVLVFVLSIVTELTYRLQK